MKKMPKSFLDKLNSVTAKRPKTVIQYILEHGYVTTEDLKQLGYEHAPRAARDVREQGIPLESFRVKDTTGKTIAAYRFGDYSKIEDKLSKVTGRTVLSSALKKALIDKYGSKCNGKHNRSGDPGHPCAHFQIRHDEHHHISQQQGEEQVPTS